MLLYEIWINYIFTIELSLVFLVCVNSYLLSLSIAKLLSKLYYSLPVCAVSVQYFSAPNNNNCFYYFFRAAIIYTFVVELRFKLKLPYEY